MAAEAGAITVVVPVWDAYVAFLPAAIGSVPDGARVVVVDNASQTPLPALPPAVSILSLARRVSAGAARNTALPGIETPLVAFLDADDAFLPGALELLAGKQADGAVGVAGRRLNVDPATGRETPTTRMPRPEAIRLSRRQRPFALLNIAMNTFPINTGLWSTDAVRRAGGFGDADVGEDWVLGAALAQLGRVILIDEPTVRHRVEAGSLWRRPHPRSALLARSRQVRRRIVRNPELPPLSRLAALLAGPLHYAVVRLQVRGDSFTPKPDLPGEGP